ncbi:MAG: hypothetical protein HC880_14930 [Bacteroidia bacterium]|nr:hypothetical protein [Bacteroidia bacterium]
MKQLKLILTLVCAFVGLAQAQVTTEPAFPTADAPVRIIYDATQGAGNLEGVSRVKMHSGVILTGPTGATWTNVVGEWGNPNAPGEMTKVPGETDKWEITITPRTYFNVPAGSTIYRIGMVFREAGPCGGFGGNNTGCKEGKNPNNQDIFVDISQGGLQVSFSQPPTSGFLVDENELVNVVANASQSATMKFIINGVEQPAQTNVTQISTDITVTENQYTIIAVAEQGALSGRDTISFLKRLASPVVALPEGIKDGINYIDDNTVTLSLLAPNKDLVYLIGDFNNWSLNPDFLMNQSHDSNRYWITLDNLNPGQEYAYQYVVYDTEGNFIKIADPYTDKLLFESDNDSRVTNNYPNLKSYPYGLTTGPVAIFQTAQTTYAWQSTNYQRPDKKDLVIYELLVRDFDTPKNFQAVIDRLDYLQNMGVNAIELMPVMEFAGNESWGYNPIFYFAPDKSYGTKDKLKELIDKAHARGMAVILDMVLNHADFEFPYVKMYFKDGRPFENPFFNPQATHPFSVFFDFNHESDLTKALVDTVNAYWLREYRFDGFRFDLSKGFTQTQSGDNVGLWSNRDNTRIALLKRMADKMWQVDPEAYVILEHFADNGEEKELAEYRSDEGKGMMLWGNMHTGFKQNSLGYMENSDIRGSYAQTLQNGGGRSWQVPHLIAYMESHDEERQMYENIQFGNSSGNYNVKNLATGLERIKAAATFLFSIPGPKMFWQFGELGYDVSINENGRVGEKPIRWNYFDETNRRKLYDLFSEIIGLRQSYDIFDTDQVSIAGGTNLSKQITLRPANGTTTPTHADEMTVYILGNFDVVARDVEAAFPHTGTWYHYFSGSEDAPFNISSPNQTLRLAPGEFRLYTNYPLPAPPAELTVFSKPLAPTNLTATPQAANRVQLSWQDNSTIESQYQIWRATSASGPFTQVATANANATTATDENGLSGETQYFYKVIAQTPSDTTESAVAVVSTPLSAENPQLARAIRVYPNPGNGEVYIALEQAPFQQLTLQVQDSQGQTLQAYDLSKQLGQKSFP